MYNSSAFDVDFSTAVSSFRSVVLVSKSQHARVYRCCFAPPGSSIELSCCVKTMQVDDAFLQQQLNLFARLAETSRNRESRLEDAKVGVLPLLWFGIIPGLARKKYDASLYVVTPWVEGFTLSYLITKAVQSKRAIAISEALALLHSVARSLRDFSRCEGDAYLVHQDIKPSNILVTADPHLRAVIIDLDTAFFLDEMPYETPYGSYGYTAPEALTRSGLWANETMDVFSFGVVAHEVLTGCWPYPFPPRPGDDARFWVSHFRGQKALCVSDNLPPDIRHLLESCVSFDPEKRPSHEGLVRCLDVLVERYADRQELFCVFDSSISPAQIRENAAISDTF